MHCIRVSVFGGMDIVFLDSLDILVSSLILLD